MKRNNLFVYWSYLTKYINFIADKADRITRKKKDGFRNNVMSVQGRQNDNKENIHEYE